MSAINTARDSSSTTDPKARVLALRRSPGIAVLPGDDLERICATALQLLVGTGVAVSSDRVAERLGAVGAAVDGGRVRLPTTLVEEALRSTPREILLAARDPECDLPVGGVEGWLGTGGPAGLAVDLDTDERRAATLADVVAAARLADALPQLAYLGPSVAALDVDPAPRPLLELQARVANTSKHVQLEVPGEAATAEALIEIARAVAGGEGPLRERPVVSAFLVTAPLALDGDGLEAAIALARAGIPCGFVAKPVAGVSAPATLAGALVTALAEALAGVAALQLLAPGAPTFVGSRAFAAALGDEPRPGGPHDPLFQMAWVQLARHLGLPVQVGAFATGSKSSDWQAGLEGGLSATASWMMGPDLLAAAGLRSGGRVFSPVAMLLDAELFDLVRPIPLGFDVDEDTLALEVIEKVGPGDHFLGEPHTLRHMREAWTARFMDTDTWEAWEEAGRPQPPERARSLALELLASHEPTSLAADAEERIGEVIAGHGRDRG